MNDIALMCLCPKQLNFSWIYIGNRFRNIRVTNGEYIVKISRGIVVLVNSPFYIVQRFDFFLISFFI